LINLKKRFNKAKEQRLICEEFKQILGFFKLVPIKYNYSINLINENLKYPTFCLVDSRHLKPDSENQATNPMTANNFH